MKWQVAFLMIFVSFIFRPIILNAGEEKNAEQIQYEMVPARNPQMWQFPEFMEVTIVNEYGMPLEGMTVTVSTPEILSPQHHNRYETYKREYSTDDQGKVKFGFDDLAAHPFNCFRILVSNHDKSFQVVLFYATEQENTNKVIPAKMAVVWPSYSLTHEYLVTDEQGNGIENVKIEMELHVKHHSNNDSVFVPVSGKTNADGIFRVGLGNDSFGKKWTSCRITLVHDNFEKQELNISHDEKPNTTIVLKAKPLINGRVIDENDQPIAGANIINFADGIRTSFSTDEDGCFSLRYSVNSPSPFFVDAIGKQSQTISFDSLKSNEFLEIKMRSGNTIRICAIDEIGKTIPGVEVLSFFNVGYEVPFLVGGEPVQFMKNGLPVRGTIAEDGTWQWSDAAREEYCLQVIGRDSQGKVAYEAEKAYYRLRPQEEPYIIKMKRISDQSPQTLLGPPPTKRIRIRVLDYDTGKSCSGVKMTLGLSTFPNVLANAVNRILEKDYSTNENGEIALDFSQVLAARQFNHISFRFHTEGYYGKSLSWHHNVSLVQVPIFPQPAVSIPPRDMLLPRAEAPLGMLIPDTLEISLVKVEEDAEE